MWVDFRNNSGINTIPGQLVRRFMERREKRRAMKRQTEDEKESISVQDAMNGKVV